MKLNKGVREKQSRANNHEILSCLTSTLFKFSASTIIKDFHHAARELESREYFRFEMQYPLIRKLTIRLIEHTKILN